MYFIFVSPRCFWSDSKSRFQLYDEWKSPDRHPGELIFAPPSPVDISYLINTSLQRGDCRELLLVNRFTQAVNCSLCLSVFGSTVVDSGIRSHPPPQPGCPAGDPGPLAVLYLSGGPPIVRVLSFSHSPFS